MWNMPMAEKNTLLCPEIRVFAGPNGSGKSTFTTPEWIVPPYINADEIQVRKHCDMMAAAIEASQLREDAISEGRSFTFETVMSKERNLLLLEKAKRAGYFIKGYYILTQSPAINIARVQVRVHSGGHDVPTDKIISRYYESLALLPRLYDACDILHVYDNSEYNAPYRLIRKHKQSTTFYPNEYWSEQKLRHLIAK